MFICGFKKKFDICGFSDFKTETVAKLIKGSNYFIN